MADDAAAEGPAPGRADRLDWRCYRHPGREGGVRCTRCERPICPDCMISAPVGFQCPECVRQAPAVRSLRHLRAAEPWATYALIAVSAVLFLPSLAGGAVLSRAGNDLAGDLALRGPEVAAGEWYRMITSGFLHYGLMHIAFNMLILYQLGLMLEPALGRSRYVAVYAAGLLGGSLGVLLLRPDALTAGASGAVFGLMGAAVVGMRRRGVDPMQSGIGGLLLINLVLTFVIPGISIGGHLGGLAGGAAAGAIAFGMDSTPAQRWGGLALVVGLTAAFFVAGLWVADNPL